MLVRRSIFSALGLGFAFTVAACSAAEPEASTASTTEAELRIAPSGSDASLTLTGEGGVCVAFSDLVAGKIDDLRALCGEGEIALPREIAAEGCAPGSVTSVTFRCFVPDRPTGPGGACRPLLVKSEAQPLPPLPSSPGGDDDAGEALAPLVCPPLGEAPDGPTPSADGPSSGAGPSAPPSLPSKPKAPPAVDPPAGAPSHGGPTPPNEPRPRPRIRCCAPPPPPQGAGGTKGVPPSSGAPSAPSTSPSSVD